MEAGGKDAARAAEEEALKRNTDCVYFLASPLTCKKGVECEYRHSEGARVNPRDCWFWLNGNCLNLKCSFRHPPLDGLIGTPTSTSGSAPPAQPKIPTQASSTYSATQNPSKQNIPCYYFQRGGCLKGDRCPFAHGSAPVPNPAAQQAPKATAPVTEPPQTIRRASWSLNKASKQNAPNETSDQPVEVVPSAKPPAKGETPAAANGLPKKEIVQSNIEFHSRSETSGVPLAANIIPSRSQSRQSEPLDDEYPNDREGDDFFRESSPGFDVLVDDETEEPGYFCEEDEYGGASGHDGRSVNPAADFNYHHSSDYETVTNFRREPYSDANEYGHHVHTNDYYAQEHRGALSERASERQSVSDRRRSRREDNLTVIDGSDLRHQLLKKRRVGTSRSSVGSDPRELPRNDDRYFEEQRYRSHGRRSDQRNGPREVSTSKRLQGRISLPRRMPGDSNGDMHPEREIDGGRSWGRLSPGNPSIYHQRRIHDRPNRRSNESFRSDERNFRAPRGRGDDQGTLDFAGPKRLSELKSMKVSNASEQRSSDGNNDSILSREQRNAKRGKALGLQDSAETTEFEGPQPLSVILKRKREAAAVNNMPAGNEERSNKVGESLAVASTTSAYTTPGSQIHQSSESSGKDNQEVDPEAAAVDIEEEDPMMGGDADQPYAKGGADGLEEGMDYNEEDQELEDYEQGDEEYYQEDNEYVEYEGEGGENVYEDEEGEDGFAKKLAMLN